MSIRQLVKQASAVPSKLPWLARETTEHLGDLAGYGLMTAGVLDAIRQRHLQSKAVAPPASDAEGSLIGGEKGQLGTDLGGLGMMAVPTIAALRHGSPQGSAGGGSKATNLINLASLAALAAPAADSLQARLRSQPGEDPEHKHLMSHGVHNALELGGLAGFGVSALRGHEPGHGLATASTLAGLGTLAAPYIDDVQAHARTPHGEDPQAKRLFTPQARSMSELAGLGLLAASAASHLIPMGKHAGAKVAAMTPEQKEERKRGVRNFVGGAAAGTVATGVRTGLMHSVLQPYTHTPETTALNKSILDKAGVPFFEVPPSMLGGMPGAVAAKDVQDTLGNSHPYAVAATAGMDAPGVIAHELGHIQQEKSRAGRAIQGPTAQLMKRFGGSILAGGASGALTGMSDNPYVQAAGRWAPAAAMLPTLAAEIGATHHGLGLLKAHNAAPEVQQHARNTLAKAFGTYATQTAASVAAAHMGQGGVRAINARSYQPPQEVEEKVAARLRQHADELLDRADALLVRAQLFAHPIGKRVFGNKNEEAAIAAMRAADARSKGPHATNLARFVAAVDASHAEDAAEDAVRNTGNKGLGLIAGGAGTAALGIGTGVHHLTHRDAPAEEKVAMSHAREALSHVLDPDLEKVAASLAGWSIPQTRSGRRPMSVMTMLKKDAEGTLRKTANWLGTPQSNTGIGTPETGAEARSKRYPWEAPSREDGYSDKAKVMDRRNEAAVVPPHGVTLTDIKLD